MYRQDGAGRRSAGVSPDLRTPARQFAPVATPGPTPGSSFFNEAPVVGLGGRVHPSPWWKPF